MLKKRVLTVRQYVENRGSDRYNKKIRVIGTDSHLWTNNADRIVDSVKVTADYIFIRVKER